MAKAKAKPKSDEEKKIPKTVSLDYAETDDEINAAILAVDEAHKITTVSGKQLLDRDQMVIPMSPSVDSVGGAVPEGSWVTLSSPEGFGKTTTALTFAATCQRPEYGSRRIFYYVVEGRLKKRDLRGIKGLNTESPMFNVIESKKGRILSSTDYLSICAEYIARVPGSVHIIDSVSALVNPTVMQGGLGTEDRAAGYKIVGQFCDLNSNVVPANKAIVIGIVQLIANTSGKGGPGKVPKVPNRWRFQTDVWLEGQYAERWTVGADENSEQIGQKLHWRMQKTALNLGAGGKCESYLRYGVGIDKLYELIVFAKDLGLITGSGWNTFDFLNAHPELLAGTPYEGKEKVQFQGMEKTYNALEENPAWMEALQSDMTALYAGEVE